MSELLTNCPVCAERYEEKGDHTPRILPCVHTVCESCIRGQLQKDGLVDCPNCSTTHNVESSMENIPKNAYIITYIRKSTTNDDDTGLCKRHYKELNLYCNETECQVAMCVLCLKDTHKNHDFSDLSMVTEERQENLRAKLRSMKLNLGGRKEHLINLQGNVANNCKKCVAKVLDNKNKILEKLKKDFDKLVKEVREQKAAVDEKVNEELSEINGIFEILQKLEDQSCNEASPNKITKILEAVKDIDMVANTAVCQINSYIHVTYRRSSVPIRDVEKFCGKLVKTEREVKSVAATLESSEVQVPSGSETDDDEVVMLSPLKEAVNSKSPEVSNLEMNASENAAPHSSTGKTTGFGRGKIEAGFETEKLQVSRKGKVVLKINPTKISVPRLNRENTGVTDQTKASIGGLIGNTMTESGPSVQSPSTIKSAENLDALNRAPWKALAKRLVGPPSSSTGPKESGTTRTSPSQQAALLSAEATLTETMVQNSAMYTSTLQNSAMYYTSLNGASYYNMAGVNQIIDSAGQVTPMDYNTGQQGNNTYTSNAAVYGLPTEQATQSYVNPFPGVGYEGYGFAPPNTTGTSGYIGYPLGTQDHPQLAVQPVQIAQGALSEQPFQSTASLITPLLGQPEQVNVVASTERQQSLLGEPPQTTASMTPTLDEPVEQDEPHKKKSRIGDNQQLPAELPVRYRELRSISTKFTYMHMMGILRDGSVVTCGKIDPETDKLARHRFTQFNPSTGEEIFTTRVNYTDVPDGITTFTSSSGCQCVALSNSRKHKIDFYDSRNLETPVQSYSVKPHQPGRLCTIAPSVILYSDSDRKHQAVRAISCSDYPPTPIQGVTNIRIFDRKSNIQDMCCAAYHGKDLLITSHHSHGVHAYNHNTDEQEWTIHGRLYCLERNINAVGLALGEGEKLFVCDIANKCIHAFHLNSDYLGITLKYANPGICRPIRMVWCASSGSAIVTTQRRSSCTITVFKPEGITRELVEDC